MDGCVSLLMLWHFGSFHFGVGNQKVVFSSLLASLFQIVSFFCFKLLAFFVFQFDFALLFGLVA